jgi:hypothetical protein
MVPVKIQLFFMVTVEEDVSCPFAFLLPDIVVWCQIVFVSVSVVVLAALKNIIIYTRNILILGLYDSS